MEGFSTSIKRSALPLSTGVLEAPAEFALRLLLASRVESLSSWAGSGHLSKDASLVLGACKALRQCRDQDNTVLDDPIVAATAHTLVESLSGDTLLKLSLITWHLDSGLHFNASLYAPSPALAHFLKHPYNDTIWAILYDRYQSRMGLRDPLLEFKASHDFLLFPNIDSLSNGA